MTYDDLTARATPDTELRQRALERLKKRHDFRGHVLIYLAVNAFLVVLWAVTTGTDAFFWPVFPIAGWGIGVVAHWWDAYHGDDISEDDIRREMERLSRPH
jgi:hypothetical protein